MREPGKIIPHPGGIFIASPTSHVVFVFSFFPEKLERAFIILSSHLDVVFGQIFGALAISLDWSRRPGGTKTVT